MTKDELMQMAEKAGIEVSGGEAWINQYHLTADLIAVVNAILERAAVELATYGVIQDMGGADAAEIVRDLKINTGATPHAN